MSVADALAEFLVYLRVKRDLSAQNVQSFYAYPLRAILLPWCVDAGIADLAQLDGRTVDRLALHLADRTTRTGAPLATATRVAYLKAVRHFLTWAEEQGAPATSQRVGLPRMRRIHRDVLSAQEMRQLEDAARSDRDRLLVAVMVETGAREGEVAALRVTDVIERERRYWFLRVRGKTGERMVPISAELHRRLKAYVGGKGRPKTSSAALFVTDIRRPGATSYEGLSESGIYRTIRDAADRADLGKRVYPHLLRHSALTLMVADGMHPAMISDIAGVSVAVIAQHYSHPSDRQRWEARMRREP